MKNYFSDLREVIKNNCNTNKNDILFINDDNLNSINNKSLKQQIYIYSNKISSYGINNGDYVILQISEKKNYMLTLLSLIYIGAIPIILPICSNKGQYKQFTKIMNDNSESCILCDKIGKEYIDLHSQNEIDKLFVLDILTPNYEIESDILDNFYNLHIDRKNDIALILYSSGSTSDPKGIAITHSSILNVINEASKQFKVTEEDVFLTWMPIEHTIGLIFFVFLPMLTCSKVIYSNAANFIQNPTTWFDLIEKYSATISAAPNFAFRLVSNAVGKDKIWDLSTVKTIFNGGEPISKKVVGDFIDVTKNFSLHKNAVTPAYGLTECTSVVVFNQNITEESLDSSKLKTSIDYDINNSQDLVDDLICQGEPLQGTNVRIVDDSNLIVPNYHIGNVQIGGSSLSKGYLNNNNDDLFTNRWLNTGDIGFLVNSNLYVIGRKKDMFFSNGKNIYLRDVEQIIKDMYDVPIAACGENIASKGKSYIYVFMEMNILPDEHESKKKEIIQLVLNNSGIKVEDVIFMDKLLTTQVGKISKGKLLRKYKENKNNININTKKEEKLINNSDSIISNLSKIFNIELSSDSPVIEILDESIKMFKNIGIINKYFNSKIGMLDIAKSKTIGQLAERIKKSEKVNCTNGHINKFDNTFPLTLIQEAYLLGREQEFYKAKNSTHYYFEIEHNLDLQKAEDCIFKLISRHEMLRATFNEDSQHIVSNDVIKKFTIEKVHLPNSEALKFIENNRLLSQQINYQSGEWPFLKIINVNIDDNKNIAIIDIDLIIADGFSLKILMNDFIKLYTDQQLPNIKSSYKDYIEYVYNNKSDEKYNEDKKFWESKVNRFPLAPKLPMNLEIDKKANIYERVEKTFSIDEWNTLECFSTKVGTTVSVVLFYLYTKTLAKWSENTDFTVNVTILDRPSSMEGIDDVVGDFTTNVLFDHLLDDYSNNIIEDITMFKEKLYEYFDHNTYEGIEVIRDISKAQKIKTESLMPIVFTSMLFGESSDFNLCNITYSRSQTSQVSLDNQIHKLNDGYKILWDYLGKIYNRDIISDMFKYYCNLIQNVIQGSIDSKVIVSGEKELLEYNNTCITKEERTLDRLIEEAFNLYSDKKVIIDNDNSLTYGQLKNKTNYLIAKLQKMGIKKGDYVITLTNNNISSIAAIVALVRMGAIYVPVPCDYPSERIEYIKQNSNSEFIINCDEIYNNMDEELPDFSRLGLSNKHDSVYVIYTSGSTGVPKGVEISHEGVVNTVVDINRKFSVNKDDCILGISSLNFDLSVYDVFGTIISGGTLLLIKEPRDSFELKDKIDSNCATIWNSVPAFMELFLESLEDSYINNTLRCILLSGDWINVDLPERIKKHFPKATVVSLGGATEASIWSIYYIINEVKPTWKSIPYGYPLGNQAIYILDKNLEICPTDVIGEIYIGGMGVAVGYLGNEEKTKESFIKTKEFGRLYKTGDYGKFKREGYVEFLGRKDKQVKIGGYRIELGEIESKLRDIQNIKDVAVTVNNNKLVAYYTSLEQSQSTSIIDNLKKYLPDYMIPYKYIKLDEIPLNANGKVDINLITEINEEDIPVTVTPTQVTVTPIEKKMKEIWENALKTNDIGINDDFFYLGGDSITAQRIGRKILEQFGVKISFTTIINEGNIRNLSLIIESKLNENNIEENILEEVAITNTKEEIILDKDILHLKKKVIKENKNNVIDIEIPKEYPLTGVQLAYLNGKNDNFELGKYNAHYYFEVETSFDTYKLQQAIEKLVKRHEILHSIFLREGIQKVLEKIPKYEVEVIDVTNSPEDEQEKININIRKELSHKIYDHEKWPMFDFKVLEKGNDKRILFVSIDLMICDGDSLQIMLSELAKYVEDDSVNEELNYSYGQYVMELLQSKENEEYYAAKEYWQSKLNSLPEFPQVPMTQKISLCKDYTINRKHKTIPYNNWQKIKSIAKTKRVSPSALLCAIYGMVLSKWSNQLDLVLNMTVFERKPFHEDVEKLVGDFTKLVPLEVHINSENIWDIAKDVQNEILTDLEYLAYDGTELMREIAKSQGSLGKALMPVVFTCILFDSPTNYFNQLGELQYAVSQTPQVLIDNQIIEMEGELNISWDYVEQLFDPEIMENIFNEFIDTINSISENDVIYIENSQEIIKLWDEYNDTTKEYIPTTLQKLFEDQVKESPLATAITYKNKNYSYELIDKKANQVARYLCANGICGSNTRVAVLALRKPETIISILGILKTGAAYVPIDPKFPKERREYIIQDSNCSMYLDNSLYESTKLNDYQDTSLGIVTNPNSLAYIIYTSGSTGMPKGVMIEHFAVCNTIQDINEKIDLSSKDCLIGISSICFDLSVYDLFGTFSKGARLVIVEDPRNSIEITEILSREKVTVWNSVPIIFSMVLNHIKTTESKNEFNLRQILLSGDWIPLEIPSLSKKIFGDGEVMSLGGATEGSIWSIYYNINEVNTSWKSIPYGMPLRNQTMLVLDYNLNLCPPGVKGDIFIGGVGVAKGYNNDIVKTEAAFITHREFGKIYKTGDIGIFHKEGYIEFIGRVDNQIKIRGYRVELGEIESVLAQQEEISEIVVLPVNSANNSKQLVAYFVSDNNEDIDVTIIKERISTFLPDYMIPSKFVQLSNIPITNNGKVDRKNLPLPDENMNNNDDYESPKTELQKKLVEIWKDIFELDIIGIKDDFYNLGGDSIILMKMIDRISSELSANISIEDILDSETIENLSDLINKEYDYSA